MLEFFFMKKILGIVILALLLSGNSYAGKKDVGKGELIFQDWLVDYFYEYIKGKGFKYPGTFVVAVDGSYAVYWYCKTVITVEILMRLFTINNVRMVLVLSVKYLQEKEKLDG